jgi:outer membrane protein assembly factor BamB
LGDSTPALVGGKLYVFARQGADEVTVCLDAATGKEVWQDKNPGEEVRGPAAGQHAGPRSSPAVAEGKVVTLGVGGAVSCLEAATGKVAWRKNDFPGAWPRFYTAMSPVLAQGLCIVQLGKGGEGAVVAYDLATGNEKWKSAGDGPGYASPVVATIAGTPLIVTQTDKSVVALSLADGKPLWQAPFAPQGMAYNAATPIVDGQTVIYSGQGRGTKAVKLEKQGEALTATELWSNTDNSVQFDSPVLRHGLVFGLSQQGKFYCINAETGKTAWTEAAGGRGGFGSIVDAGSVLLGLTAKSQLVVIEPTDKEYKELASIKVADTPTYAHPVVAGNRIFIKDQNAVTLWAIE